MAEHDQADGDLKPIRESLAGLDPEEKKELAAATVREAGDEVKGEVAAAALRAVPHAARDQLVAAAVREVPDEMKTGVAAAAVRALPDQGKKDLVAAAVGAASNGAEREAAAVQAVPNDMKESVVAKVVADAPSETKREVADAAVRGLSADDRRELAERFLPSQPATDKIWLIIVVTFGVVLFCATLALIAGVMSIVRKETDAALVQILPTASTTVAGILAGFISGRMSAGATR